MIEARLVGIELADGRLIRPAELTQPVLDISYVASGRSLRALQALPADETVTLYFEPSGKKAFHVELILKKTATKIFSDDSGLNSYLRGQYYYLVSPLKRGGRFLLASSELTYRVASMLK